MIKDLYDLINLRKYNIEDEINKAIMTVKSDLKGLTKEQTCMIYSMYLQDYFNKKGILSKLINTKEDLHFNYEHVFIVIPKGNSYQYIVDLTYDQFGYDERFKVLYERGYQLVNATEYQEYLEKIANIHSKRM